LEHMEAHTNTGTSVNQRRAAKIVWIIAGLAGWVFALLLVIESLFPYIFPYTLESAMRGKDAPTFFGWWATLFVTAIVWLMTWRTLTGVRCRRSISIFLASSVAVCLGSIIAMGLGYDWLFGIFGVWAIIIPTVLGGGSIFIVALIGVAKTLLSRYRPNKEN
jgi:hypothetical protein